MPGPRKHNSDSSNLKPHADTEASTADMDGRKKPDKEPNLESEESSSGSVPDLNKKERHEVSQRANISAVVVHETVREEGERELRRTPMTLAWSALAAGLSMGFSLVAEGLLHTYLPPTPWRPLIDNLGYSIGFLIVILGRQQLFTENTVTVILPLLAHPNLSTLWRIVRLWLIVLIANLAGTLIFAAVIAHTALFTPDIQHSFTEISQHSMRGEFGLTILRGIFAGWLIALMVWLLPAAQETKLHIIILITYLVSLGGFAHIIAGSVDAFYLVNTGAISWSDYFTGFMSLPSSAILLAEYHWWRHSTLLRSHPKQQKRTELRSIS